MDKARLKTGSVPVRVAARVYGRDPAWVRAGIIAGWLPIGQATRHGKKLFNGKLAKYLDDPKQAKALSQALKIAINSVYGLTSATFDNPFRNPKNANNIVALRGALFMRTLQDKVQQRGFTVAHIKTDSIKIPDATPEIIDFCMKFAEKYRLPLRGRPCARTAILAASSPGARDICAVG